MDKNLGRQYSTQYSLGPLIPPPINAASSGGLSPQVCGHFYLTQTCTHTHTHACTHTDVLLHMTSGQDFPRTGCRTTCRLAHGHNKWLVSCQAPLPVSPSRRTDRWQSRWEKDRSRCGSRASPPSHPPCRKQGSPKAQLGFGAAPVASSFYKASATPLP